MRYFSVCSGIEAATVAWAPLGFHAAAVAELEAFPSAVLQHHYPSVPNWGDITRFQEWPDATVDLLVGGTPCQSFSVAGLRAGLADPRGNLALVYLAILDRYRPAWCVWENVPGVLSSAGGRDFGAFLGGLAKLGYGFAYRVLDAQYFGVPQRRRRVFVVGSLGGWARAASVLFERDSLLGYPPPGRETGPRITDGTLSRALSRVGGGDDPGANKGAPIVVATLDANYGRLQGCSGQDATHNHSHLITHSLRGDGFDGSEDGTGRGTPLVTTLAIRGRGDSSDLECRTDGTANAILTPNGGRCGIGVGAIAFSVKDHGADAGDLAPTLRSGGHDKSHANGGVMPAIAFDTTQITSAANRSNPKSGDPCYPLAAGAHAPAIAFADVADPIAANQARTYTREGSNNFRVSNVVHSPMAVRRLTPRECERLQGFPDDYTLVPYRGKPAADGPRYKALGNSMAVPVMAWIGRRLLEVAAIP